MGALVSTKELSEQLGIKQAKIRRWKKEGVFTPIRVDSDDGKTLLYNIDCERIKFKIAQELLLEFTIKEIGKKFQKVFGKRNGNLLKELQRTKDEERFIEKYVEEIMSLEIE